jgi:HD superfamily phosphohydrolase
MTLNVYRHRVRLITDQMIVRAICLGIDVDQITELRDIYTYTGDKDFFKRYVRWDDSRLALRFSEGDHTGTHCGQLFQRLESRNLHKLVFSEKAKHLGSPEVVDRLLSIGKSENRRLRADLESEIAEVLRKAFGVEVDPYQVIVHGFDVKSVRTTSRNDEAKISVSTVKGVRTFEDESTLFASINEQYADGFIEVYAPVRWNSRAMRRKYRRELYEPIASILRNVTSEAILRLQGGQNEIA